VYNSWQDSGPPGSNSSWSRSGGSPAGAVALGWRDHAEDEEFDEACELAAGLRFKEVSRSEAA
jgi:hypothetical protein